LRICSSQALAVAAMALCDVCQKIDIRGMLQLVASSHWHWDDSPSEMGRECQYCSLQDTGIPHHSTYAALKDASDDGCGLCRLIRRSISRVKGRDSSNSAQSSQDEMDQSLLPVVLYPHCLNDDGELPNIEVAVGSDYPPDFRCVLEIFAPRGMQSHQLSWRKS
jgi:hypothetical protein